LRALSLPSADFCKNPRAHSVPIGCPPSGGRITPAVFANRTRNPETGRFAQPAVAPQAQQMARIPVVVDPCDAGRRRRHRLRYLPPTKPWSPGRNTAPVAVAVENGLLDHAVRPQSVDPGVDCAHLDLDDVRGRPPSPEVSRTEPWRRRSPSPAGRECWSAG